MNEIVQYVTENGSCPIQEWYDKLDLHTAARITTTIERMKAGNYGDHKTVGEGVTERRLDFGPGYRIYFGRDGSKLVVLLGGGTKRRQQSDIEKAKVCWKDYKARKKENR